MKKYFLSFVLCVSLFSTKSQLLAQENFPWQSSITQIGTKAWGAGGAYIARKGLPTAAFLNPAGLDISGFSIYLESGKRLGTDFKGSSDFSVTNNFVFESELDNQFILPGFVGLSIPINQLFLSIGYANSYNFKFNPDMTSITVAGGTGAIITPALESKMHNFFASLKYKFNNHVEFGLTATANYLTELEDLESLQIGGSGLGLGFIAGGVITISESVAFGIGAKYNREINYKADLSGSLLNPNPNDGADRGSSPIIIETDNQIRVKFPWSLQSGVTYTPTQSMSFSVMFDYQVWSFASERLDNELQLHVGSDFQLSNVLGLSLGFFTTNNPKGITYFALPSQNFLTAGISLKLAKHVELSASILDAHLLTDSDFQQTYIMAGLQYGLE